MIANSIFQELIKSYPFFEPNQVLTHGHLNRIVDFLDQQNRLTRICLIGMGIVCGLEGRWEEECLLISEGCGITSDGFLIQTEACKLKFYQSVNLPLEFMELENNLELKTDFPNGLPFFELFDAEPSGLFEGLTQEFSHEKVLLILLECRTIKNDLCLNDCDEKGSQLNYILRKFLVDVELARRIIDISYNPTLEEGGLLFPGRSVENLFYDQFAIPNLFLERFGYFRDAAGTSSSLSNIINFDIFSQRYFQITENVTERIHTVFENLIKVFSPVFSSFQITKAQQDELLSLIPVWQDETGSHPYEIQYRYDHLCDLVLAYNEFIEVTSDLIADCPPQSFRFPKHLWLGQMGVESEYPLSIYRTPITQPPIFNGNHHRLAAAKTLFYRLFLLAQGFKVPANTFSGSMQLRITPSRINGAPLSSRAIPYYYENHLDLRKNWNPVKGRRGRWREVHSYYRPLDTGRPNLPFDDPLVYDLDSHDFLRIEGHLGKDYEDVVETLEFHKRQYNLAFDIVALKLGETYDGDLDFSCPEFDTQYHKLRIDLLCELEESLNELFPNGIPDEIDAVYSELRDALTENLSHFVYSFETGEFRTGAIEFGIVFEEFRNLVLNRIDTGHRCPFSLDQAVPFEFLYNSYQTLLKETRRKLLFHGFADLHPGMEHKGGVPIGGTFILVYVDPDELGEELADNIRVRLILSLLNVPIVPGVSLDLNTLSVEQRDIFEQLAERQQIIIADFYLPYLCCGDKAGLSFVVPRQPPVISVTPTEFCADIPIVGVPPQQYPLQIVSFPAGAIPSGPGIVESGGMYYFVPANVDPALVDPFVGGNVAITFRVGAESTVIPFTLLPLPVTAFEIISDLLSVEMEICDDQVPILAPQVPDGTFTILRDGVIQDIITPNLEVNLNELNLNPGQTVEIIIRYDIAPTGGCAWFTEKTIFVTGRPVATFQIFRDGTPLEEPFRICVEEGSVTLVPTVELGLFTASVNGNSINIETGNVINFDEFTVEDGAFVNVVISHEVQGLGNCPSETVIETLRVDGRPLAGFQVFSGTNPIEEDVCFDDPDVNIQPDEEGGTFTIFEGTIDRTAEILGTGLSLNLSVLAIPDGERTELAITHDIEDTNGCTNSQVSILIVTGRPLANFELFHGTIQIEDGGSVCEDEGPVNIEVPGDNIGQFSVWRDGSQLFELTSPQLDLTRDDLELDQGRTISIRHDVALANGCANFAEITFAILPRANAEFQILDADGSVVNQVFVDQGPVTLNRQNIGQFRFRRNGEVIDDDVVIVDDGVEPRQLDLASILEADTEATLEIQHAIRTSPQRCGDETEFFSLTICARLNPGFSVNVIPNNNEDPTEYTVEVFNIQPANAPASVGFLWSFPADITGQTDREGRDPFSLIYPAELFQTGASIPIRLEISHGPCVERVTVPVTPPAIDFGVEALILISTSLNPSANQPFEFQMTGTDGIQDGDTYSIFDFEPQFQNNFGFNIEAIPFGASVVESIRFELEEIGVTDTINNINNGNNGRYRLFEGEPFFVPLSFDMDAPRTFTIRALAFTQDNAQGDQAQTVNEKTFTIEPGQEPRSAGTRATDSREEPEENGISLLNSRASKHRNDLNDLAGDANLAKTKAFGLANLFVSVMGTEEQLSSKFEEALSAILTSLKRAKSDRKAQLKKLVGIVLHNYLDKLVAGNKESISEQVKDLLKKSCEKMKKADVSPATLKRQWKSKELKDKLNAKVVSEYMKLLK